TRHCTPPFLLPHFDLIRPLHYALNIPILEVEGWEADDVIATLAKRAREEGFRTLVVTCDKDFIQMVAEDVRLYDPMQEKHTGPAEVVERLGIQPAQMRDYLALIGDAIDNVPKVPGIGPKTAVELLQQFGNVETLMQRIDHLKKPKVREALQANGDQLRRAKQLVSFRTDLPLDVEISALVRRPIHDAQTRVLFSELEFFKLLQEMPPSEVTPLQVATEVIGDRAGLEEVVRAAEGFKSITLIPAFEGLPYAAELVGLGMALPDGRNFYVPLRHQYLGVPQQLAPD